MQQRFFLKLAYNGATYCGWQIQPNALSVQKVLEHAISTLLQEDITLTGCGRTDAGVHAHLFYAHFETKKTFDEKLLVSKLNRFVGGNILIYDCFRVAADCHARFSALFRTYHYYISLQKDPFRQDFIYHIFRSIQFDEMNEAAALLTGYSDFSAFSKSHTQTFTNTCNIMQAFWEQTQESHIWVFKITANRFLRNMVRAIVGTLLEIGYGKMSIDAFKEIIESKKRCNAGVSVPASALFLMDVGYDKKKQLFI